MRSCAFCGSPDGGAALTSKSPNAASCGGLIRLGFYRCQRAYVLTDAELQNPHVVRDGRNYAAGLGVPYRQMLEFLTDRYRDYRGVFVDASSGEEMLLDMEVLESASEYWFRDMMRPCPPNIRPRIRRSARERWRVALSILRATAPDGEFWGVRAANDNTPAIPPSAA